MNYGLAIFDLDGTLLDSFPWFLGIINAVADKYRFRRIAPDQVEALRGMGSRGSSNIWVAGSSVYNGQLSHSPDYSKSILALDGGLLCIVMNPFRYPSGSKANSPLMDRVASLIRTFNPSITSMADW